MPTVTNKTPLPLTVPLPGGKKLRLGPLKSGQVSEKAIQHAPLIALADAGKLEIRDQDAPVKQTPGTGPTSKPNRSASGGIRHTGDG